MVAKIIQPFGTLDFLVNKACDGYSVSSVAYRSASDLKIASFSTVTQVPRHAFQPAFTLFPLFSLRY
jgi:thymidylate kinase